MNQIRYGISLLMICLIPGVICYWFSIHPFIRFWRRFGAIQVFTFHAGMMLLIGLAISTQRHWILSVEFGSDAWLTAAGIVLLLVAAFFRGKVGASLKSSALIGLPELDPVARPQPMLTAGVYSVIRHPRYVQILLALWGWAFIANYLALYVLTVFSMGAVYVLVLFEERELRDRFGDAYSEYARRVPRFIPRITWRR